jgi:hypothetical protein
MVQYLSDWDCATVGLSGWACQFTAIVRRAIYRHVEKGPMGLSVDYREFSND